MYATTKLQWSFTKENKKEYIVQQYIKFINMLAKITQNWKKTKYRI